MQTAVIAFDSNQLSIIMEKMLEDFGFKCFFAHTTKEIPEVVMDKRPLVLFTDWTLNEQDVIPVLPNLIPKPVLIFVSQEKDPKKIKEALDAGINEYIMKPFDNDILQSKLSLAGVL
ncbi:MAG: response regulator [Alphaproteobacteria bacterium]|nr:response regulator [Alphaproteobacteria bacterium]